MRLVHPSYGEHPRVADLLAFPAEIATGQASYLYLPYAAGRS